MGRVNLRIQAGEIEKDTCVVQIDIPVTQLFSIPTSKAVQLNKLKRVQERPLEIPKKTSNR